MGPREDDGDLIPGQIISVVFSRELANENPARTGTIDRRILWHWDNISTDIIRYLYDECEASLTVLVRTNGKEYTIMVRGEYAQIVQDINTMAKSIAVAQSYGDIAITVLEAKIIYV